MNRSSFCPILPLLFVSLLASFDPAAAQESAEPGVRLDLEAAEAFDPHHVSLFIGGATRFDPHLPDETGLAIGGEYEYRWTERWGVGGVVEGVFFHDNHRDVAIAALVSWHPIEALKVSTGPGTETSDGHTHFMWRVSLTYDFEIGEYTLGPEVAVDFADHAETFLFGLSFGRWF